MDPIAAAMGAVPLQPTEPQPRAQGPGGPGAVADEVTIGGADGAGTEAQLADQDLERYKAVAASFVQQMYMTMWREAQRNSSA